MFQKPSVLIVGAGEFGASAALELLQGGKYSTVTIIDKAPELPALDAASTDISKVVRWDYQDIDYAKLGREAVTRWNKPMWKGIYHQSGVVIRNMGSKEAINSYENSKRLEPEVELLKTPAELRAKMSPSGQVKVDTSAIPDGYYNPYGGWVNAAAAVKKLYEGINYFGGVLVPNADMASLILTENGSDVRGVKTTDGREFLADKVIVALGSWTAAHPALEHLFPKGLLVPTGQVIVMVQLDEEERKRYADIPTQMARNNTGFYSFPPNEDGLLKFALHSHGFTLDSGVPRTALVPEAIEYTQQNKLGWVPRQSVRKLREQMAMMYPEIAKKPITFTRMCWYSDTTDSNWVIDIPREYPSLLVATGGAGHAFKFLTVMGELIVNRLEGTLGPYLTKKFRIHRPIPEYDTDRDGDRRAPLRLEELVTQEELARQGGGARL